jgi:hypothetical protein
MAFIHDMSVVVVPACIGVGALLIELVELEQAAAAAASASVSVRVEACMVDPC